MITFGMFGDRRIGHRTWKPGKRLWCVNIFGKTHLDFSGAELATPATKVRILNLFGGTEVVVPPGVSVTAGGLTLFGRRDVRRTTPSTAEAPGIEQNLSLTDMNIFGEVTIRDPEGV